MAFLLLIFFMVTTTFRKEQQRDVVFPDAEATQKLEEPRKDVLNVYVEHRRLDLHQRPLTPPRRCPA
jgi:biopolymer transport protein ExbD